MMVVGGYAVGGAAREGPTGGVTGGAPTEEGDAGSGVEDTDVTMSGTIMNTLVAQTAPSAQTDPIVPGANAPIGGTVTALDNTNGQSNPTIPEGNDEINLDDPADQQQPQSPANKSCSPSNPEQSQIQKIQKKSGSGKSMGQPSTAARTTERTSTRNFEHQTMARSQDNLARKPNQDEGKDSGVEIDMGFLDSPSVLEDE